MNVIKSGHRPRPFAALTTAIVMALLAAGASSAQVVVDLDASKDNTLFESPSNASGGASEWIYAGETNRNGARRALLAFDLSEIPVGSTVQEVSLTLHVSNASPSQTDISLHRLLDDWGEGDTQEGTGGGGGGGGGATAQPGDATWLQRFAGDAGSAWIAPGGDFVGTASATAAAGFSLTDPVWSSQTNPGLIDDVQSWVDEPDGNWGWILMGAEGGSSTAVRFDSRETTILNDRPLLTVTFVPEPSAGLLGAGALAALALALRWVGRGQPEKYLD